MTWFVGTCVAFSFIAGGADSYTTRMTSQIGVNEDDIRIRLRPLANAEGLRSADRTRRAQRGPQSESSRRADYVERIDYLATIVFIACASPIGPPRRHRIRRRPAGRTVAAVSIGTRRARMPPARTGAGYNLFLANGGPGRSLA